MTISKFYCVIGIKFNSKVLKECSDEDEQLEYEFDLNLQVVSRELGIKYYHLPHDQLVNELDRSSMVVGLCINQVRGDTYSDISKMLAEIDIDDFAKARDVVKEWQRENNFEGEIRQYIVQDDCECCS